MEKIVEQVIVKIQLIIKMHEIILRNVEKVQQKRRKTYALWKWRQMFPSFVARKDMVKMKKLNKKKAFEAS